MYAGKNIIIISDRKYELVAPATLNTTILNNSDCSNEDTSQYSGVHLYHVDIYKWIL